MGPLALGADAGAGASAARAVANTTVADITIGTNIFKRFIVSSSVH
jgi:hypothetical protein